MDNLKCIAFDLDDTLLDTSGLLVPLASRNACQAMINQGLRSSLDECLALRHELAESQSHSEIFPFIVNKFGCNNPELATREALEQFYMPEVPNYLPPLAGVIENLEYLSNKYKLYLVTMGEPNTQKKKVEALRISHYFKEIYIVNGFKGHKKKEVFQDIIEKNNLEPKQLLSVGNRVSSEIRDANELGCKTCLFSHGEHRNEPKISPFDKPDKTIRHHRDLLSVCEL